MQYQLPLTIRIALARRAVRLHHVLWHVVRDNWGLISEADRSTFSQQFPRWVPHRPRFTRGMPTSGNSRGVQINYDAGESFLYMHRQMILSVNTQLAALGQPALVPWPSIPSINDADYPVPGRNPNGNLRDPKSDVLGQELLRRADLVLRPETLRSRSLAWVGAYVESFIHDPMHGRWATVSEGAMAGFPQLDPTNTNPQIDTRFDAVEADWLGHPYSSHVNSVFWKLHGWIDQVIESWRIANGLEQISWVDPWEGDVPDPHHHNHLVAMKRHERLAVLHDHIEHAHGNDVQMLSAFQLLNSFEGCHMGFDYIAKMNLEAPAI